MITFQAYWIPNIITIACLVMMFRPNQDHPMTGIFRVLWLFPLMLTWLVYLLLTRH